MSPQRQAQVDEHLGHCEGCLRFRGQLESLKADLGLLTAPEPRPGFAGRTLARLPEKPGRFTLLDRLRSILQPAPAALGTAALLLGVFLAISMNGYASSSEAADPTETLFAESLALTPTDSIGERYMSLLTEVED
jgi:hypothetical protein